MSILKVALLQMLSAGSDPAANRKKGGQFCLQAREMGADLALFPEMWSNGYQIPERSQPEEVPAWQAQAVDRNGEFVTYFQGLARELDMAIALTYLEKWPGAPRNSLSLIDRHGEIRLTYAKVHTCDFDREAFLTPGDDFTVSELDTAAGPVKVGAMICFDREFPESARILMIKGAEIVLTPNACELEANRLAQVQTRAYENMLGLAMANYAMPQENGHSAAFDGIAFDEAGSRDTCLVQADGHEGVYLAAFDLDRLRAYRQDEVWGNAYRKPSRYAILADPAVAAPFVRKDARR
ncbi:MAG TPA: carbon-nitrogen hydrolase family protein [Anaerolineales bacterium]|nr:carbon-nitrogen hydrolase family protein [Anaerolineales bacterium]